MLANRRKSERRLCRRIAKIRCGTGSLPRDCTITDVSAGGVKVVAEYLEIPSQFTIIFSPDTHANVDLHGGSAANSALNSSIRSKKILGDHFMRILGVAALCAALGGCAGPDRSGELLDTWHACIVAAVNRMDDGRTDPISIAYGIQPQCGGYYQQVVEAQAGQMITENAQVAQRQFVRDQELKLITSEILARRANRRS